MPSAEIASAEKVSGVAQMNNTFTSVLEKLQPLTEIMYRLFLRELGYARDLDLAELEITLEGEGRLDAFTKAYQATFKKDWDREKEKVAFAIAAASQVMNKLDPQRFPSPETWLKAARDRADITPGLLAERCKLLMERRRPKQTLVFVVDEVGQFVARDVQKMLDLQAVVQNLGRIGRGRSGIPRPGVARLSRGNRPGRPALEPGPERRRHYQLRPALASHCPSPLAEGCQSVLGFPCGRRV